MQFIVTASGGAEAVYQYLTDRPITTTLTVDIKDYKRDRSGEQNAIFHVWLSYISKQYYLTHGHLYAPKVWKEYFKGMLLGQESLNGPKGLMTRTRRTRDLKVKEMTEFLEQLIIYCAAEYNIILTSNNEF